MIYRCTLKTAMGGLIGKDVTAETGDEAALRALAEYPGAFVTLVEPAPANAQPHLEAVNDGGLTASQAKAAGEEELLKAMAA